MKKKLVRAGLALLVLLVVLPHTQLVESLVRDHLVEMAARNQVTLKIERLDLNLFRLSVQAEGISMAAQGMDLTLQLLRVNVTSWMLAGHIKIDEVLVEDGLLVVRQTESQQPKSTSPPPEIPPITLGQAAVRNFVVQIENREAKIDVGLDKVSFEYKDQHLHAEFQTKELVFGNRTMPTTKTVLSCETVDFKAFNNLALSLTTPASTINVNGRLDPDFAPYLEVALAVGEDLLPELSGLQANISLTPSSVGLTLSTSRRVGDLLVPLSLKTEFNYNGPLWQMPIDLEMGDLASGRLDLSRQGTQLDGILTLRGKVAGLAELVPFLDLEDVLLEAQLDLDTNHPDQLAVSSKLRVEGGQPLLLNTTYNPDGVHFNGEAQPVANGSLTFQGSYADSLEVRFAGHLPSLDGLARWVSLPPDLCVGPVDVTGSVVADDTSWRIPELALSATDAAYGSYFSDDLKVVLHGGAQVLYGSVFSKGLNSEGPVISFTADPKHEQWLGIDLNIDSSPYPLEAYQYRLKLFAQGDGPFDNPSLSGSLAVFLEKDGPLALLESRFSFGNRSLVLDDLLTHSAHVQLAGSLAMRIADPLAWSGKLVLDSHKDAAFLPLLDMELPEFKLEMGGNQSRLGARLLLPDQVFDLEKTPIPIGQDKGIEMDIVPTPPSMAGFSRGLRVAGLNLSDFSMGVEQEQLNVQTRLELTNVDTLKSTLAAWWPEILELETLAGSLRLSSALDFQTPRVELDLDYVTGKIDGTSFATKKAGLRFENRLEIVPFDLDFAGLRAHVREAGPVVFKPGSTPSTERPPISVGLDFTTPDPQLLLRFLKLPEDLEIESLVGKVELFSDLTFADPALAFSIDTLEGVYQYHHFESIALDGLYQKGLWLQNLKFDLDGTILNAGEHEGGFSLSAQPRAYELTTWDNNIVGDAVLDLKLDWVNGEKGPLISMSCSQKSGTLYYLDPWLEVTGLQVQVEQTKNGYLLKDATCGLNGGSVSLSGNLAEVDGQREITGVLEAGDIELDLLDYKLNVTTGVEFSDKGGDCSMLIFVLVNDGYLAPDIKIRGVVSELLAVVPELYFPNADLERIKLRANILTQKPLIVEHEIGFLELETPTLVFAGNLAEYYADSGLVSIKAGSSLNLGNRVYVFKESQIQFHPNRRDDPYFHIALESEDFGRKNTININGYLSQLGQNVDSDNMTDVLANYLVSQVSSLVSLQLGEGETIFDDSFTFVVSTPITRRLETRYAVPLSDLKEKQRFELTMGPFYYNYLNLVQEESNLRGNIQYTQGFGWVNRQKPQLVRKIVFSEGTEKWLRKKFKIHKGDVYSETQWRRAELDLRKRLKERGYLNPVISHRYEKKELHVSLEPGRQASLAVPDLDLSIEDQRRILRNLRSRGPASLRAAERQIERLARERKYPDSAAFADWQGDTLLINVQLSEPFTNVAVDFGPATALLAPRYTDQKARDRLVIAYLNGKEGAESKLRAQLAGMGYLKPKLGKGVFKETNLFKLPIEPGPRGVLKAIYLNKKHEKNELVAKPSDDTRVAEAIEQNSLDNDLIGKPFDYAMIGEMVTRLAKLDKKAVVKVRPERLGEDVVFHIQSERVPNPIIETLDISGAARISEKRIRRFLGFHEGMKQEELVDAQRRLVTSGPYQAVRLQNNGGSANLAVEEGNRWDADVQLSWDQEKQIGWAVQFLDHQFLNRFYPLAIKVEQNRLSNRLQTQMKFLRIFGTPVDLAIGSDINKERTFAFALSEIDGTGYVFSRTFERVEATEFRLDLNYELTRYQKIGFGIRSGEQQLINRFMDYDILDDDLTEEQIAIPENLIGITESKQPPTYQTPLALSWLYRNLDHQTDPANGVFASITASHFLNVRNGENQLLGTRYDMRITTFKTWGRWMWSHRSELGEYFPAEDSAPLNDPQDTPLFLLGGPRTVRGYRLHLLGPLEKGDKGPNPKGGNALFFFSQELTFDTRLFGVSVNPFVDGGWVWEKRENLFKTPLVITGGLGLSIDSPVGYFRLDWAVPIQDRAVENALDGLGLLEEDQRHFRKSVQEQFSFVFGRTF